MPASKSFQPLNPRFLPNHYRFRSPPQEKSGGSPHFRISDGCLLPPRELRPIWWGVGIFISSLPQEDYEGELDGISGEPASRMTSVSIMANETQDKPNWGKAQLWKRASPPFHLDFMSGLSFPSVAGKINTLLSRSPVSTEARLSRSPWNPRLVTRGPHWAKLSAGGGSIS